jgi:uncharacterized protein (TIGR03086 family)
MSECSDRFTKVADDFSQCVNAVPAGAWNNSTPCEGWVARDIIRHLVEWVPGFFTGMAGLAFPVMPSVDVDPARAWSTLRGALESHLADEAVATREFDAPMGRMSIEAAIDMIVTGDVFMHTWDLARSTGLNETLDPEVCAGMLAGMEPMDEMLRGSGHYGPRVVVSDDADAQTKLIAFIGRNPAAL